MQGNMRLFFFHTVMNQLDYDFAYFHRIPAMIPQTTPTPTQTPRTILLKSKKPLPVTVIAPTIANIVMIAKKMLKTLQTVPFFM